MAAVKDGSVSIAESDMLDLVSVRNVLKQVTVLPEGGLEKEVVKCPLPQSMLMEDRFPSRLQPFVSEVAIDYTM